MNSRLSSFLRCSCYASLRWMQHQQWLVLPFRVDQGPVLRAACSRSAPVIDCQHHVRKVDDLLVGLELRARCASFAHSRQVGAGGQHIEVSLPQIGRPFCRLLLMGRVANEHQVMVGRCPQTVDDLSGVQSHTAVTGHKELRHTILAQHHDLLRQFHLHFAAGLIFFIEAPWKTHRVLPDDGTAYRLIHTFTRLICSLLAYNSYSNSCYFSRQGKCKL